MSESTSDQKTEQPTPRRLERALEEGQIAFSSELMGALLVFAGVFFFFFFGKWFWGLILTAIRERLTYFTPMIDHPNTIVLAIRRSLGQFALGTCVLMTVVAAVAFLAGAFQTRLNVSFKPLTLDLKKLDPAKGIKRIFSTRSIARGLVAIAKSSAIIVVSWLIVRGRLEQIHSSTQLTFADVTVLACNLMFAIGFATAILMTIIGLCDYAFQVWKQNQDLRMSIQEIRDEHKEVEGDPLVKARVRRLQNERVRSRMLQDVPKATVVVRNPTHFAVALRYDPEEHEAPVVIAKGKDHLALKIIEIAEEHKIAVVERRQLARFMFASVEVGNPIPVEIYHTVAEIINFVRRAGAAA